MAGFEGPRSKTSLSNTRKWAKDKKKKIAYTLPNESSKYKVKKIRGNVNVGDLF